MKRHYASIIVGFLLTMAFGSSLHAQAPDGDEEVPGVEDEEGRREYQDVDQLKKLEATDLAPTRAVGRNHWNPGLLSPRIGFLASLRQEFGVEKPPQAPVGAALISVPKVRERFQNTQVLGLKEHQQPSVRAYLDFFDGRGKPILASWISRMGRYEAMIRKTLREEGLPEDLIFVAMIESGFSPRATSPAAAVGIWQFIPTTGSEMGLTINRYVDERRDPVKATRAACDYLKLLYTRFGSWPLALAAYNGGPGLVSKTIGRHNSNDYWFIQRHGGLYDETRRYVPKVLAAGLVTKNADLFGFAPSTVAPFKFDVVKVPGGTGLAVFARAAKTDVATLKGLNPELLRAQTPPQSTPYELRIPAGSLGTFVANYDKIRVDGAQTHTKHITKFGETIRDVAEIYEIAPRVLRASNGFGSRERVPYGTELVILDAAKGKWKAKRKSGKETIIVPRKLPEIEGMKQYLYQVEKGDTLPALSRAANVREADLSLWNYLDPNAKLQPGMILQLFAPANVDLSGVQVLESQRVSVVVAGTAAHKKMVKKKTGKSRRFYHRVKSGQSLWIIARKYRVTVEDLKKWNRSLRKSNMLQPGQKIVVYPGKKKRRKR